MGLAWLAEGLHPEGNLDASEWIEKNKEAPFDLVFVDTWAGKFTDLEAVLKMVKPNGFYLIDDLNYQAHWPGYHQEKVLFLVEKLAKHALAFVGVLHSDDFDALAVDHGNSFELRLEPF